MTSQTTIDVANGKHVIGRGWRGYGLAWTLEFDAANFFLSRSGRVARWTHPVQCYHVEDEKRSIHLRIMSSQYRHLTSP